MTCHNCSSLELEFWFYSHYMSKTKDHAHRIYYYKCLICFAQWAVNEPELIPTNGNSTFYVRKNL